MTITIEKLKLGTVKCYKSNFSIFDEYGNYYMLNTEHKYPLCDWQEDETINLFDEEGQLKILDLLKIYGCVEY